MSKYIDFNLSKYVQDAARRAAARYQSINLAEYWERLNKVDPEDVWQKMADQPEARWSGAVPVYEPAGYHQASASVPKQIMAVDGSQINSDAEMVFLWAYVQAVAVGRPGEALYKSDFCDIASLLAGDVEREDLQRYLFPNLNALGTFVDLWRTMVELDVCAAAGQHYPDHLILWDNPLLPLGAGVRSGLLREIYGERLMMLQGCAIAGLVSGPKSHLLANLVTLSEAEGMAQALKIHANADDTMLMRYGLPIGHRSAIFRYGSPFEVKAAPVFPDIFFFFARIDANEVVRVEIPAWVAKDPLLVDEVHATIIKDSTPLGYSLSLLMAHHTVTISMEMGKEMNLKAWSAYLQHGGQFLTSAKIQAKRG